MLNYKALQKSLFIKTKTLKMLQPKEFKKKYYPSSENTAFLSNIQKQIKNIFLKKDRRKIIFVGPCSIHSAKEALIYASKLKKLQEEVKDTLLLVMRFYYEKPRSKSTWRGFLYDPNLDGTNNILSGIIKTRQLLLKITQLQIPVSTEILDPYTGYFFDDLISWGFIGARTVHSQIHRQLASNFLFPVGFKNDISGNVSTAVEAAYFANQKHCFFTINQEGILSATESNGNPYTHLVLRGSNLKTNYDKHSVTKAENLMHKKLPIVIDSSHGNSQKNYKKQIEVFKNIIKQSKINPSIIGTMLESNLIEGKQPIHPINLRFGVSITDSCISFEDTKQLIYYAHDILDHKKPCYIH